MGTSNAINANSQGIVRYDGAGNFDAVTTTQHDVLIGDVSNGIVSVAPGVANTALVSNGVSADPSFKAVPGVGVTVVDHATLVGAANNSITSLALGTSGQVLTSNGAGADPSYQSLPAATGVQTLTDGSANVVSPIGGTITFSNGNSVANLSGSANHITFDVTGTNNHAVQVGNSSGSLNNIATGTSGQPLVSGGASADPSFALLTVPGGGTGASTLTGVLTGNGTSAVTASTITQYGTVVAGASNTVSSVAPGAAGTVLASNGASANPSYQTVPGVGSTVTNHAALVGGATNNIVSVGPGTTGQVLAGNTGSDPSFQAVPGIGNTVTQYDVLVGGASNSIVSVGPGSSGQALVSNGASANPSYQTIPGVGVTVTNHAAIVGGASNTLTSVGPGTTGQVLAGNTGSDPSFQTVPGIGTTVTNHATLVGGASNSITSLALGTAGQVLTSNGPGADPSYQSFSSSGTWVLLQTQNIVLNSPAVIFNSTYLTSTYKTYVFTFNNVIPVAGGSATQLLMQWSTNNGSTYINSNMQCYANEFGWNSSAWSNTNSTTQGIIVGSTVGSNGCCGHLYFFNPVGVGIAYPSYRGSITLSNRGIICGGEYLVSQTVINNIKFLFNGANNFNSGSISLYGITS